MNIKIVISGVLGALGVGLGAFGAHGLKPLLSEAQLTTYKTGVNYQMLHVVILLAIAFYVTNQKSKLLNTAFWLFTVGILFFAGSLYLISTHELIGLASWKWLGPVTPLGGLCFIFGWITIFLYGLRQNTTSI